MLGLQHSTVRDRVVPTASPAGTTLAVAAAVPRTGVSHTNRQARSPVGLAAQSDYLSSTEPPGQHAAALTNAPVQHGTPQHDPGLESFKALIAERRFTCTQCGKCCTGGGEVWIASEEAERIAAHLGLSLQRFLKRYTQANSKVAGFKQLKDNENSDCIFLQPDNTCSIHQVRPLQCSTYPWWPDLVNQYDWDWEKQNICEGFDHPDAPPTDMDEAARQLRAATVFDNRLQLAHKASRKQAAAADVAAAAGLAATLPKQQVTQSASQQAATSSHTNVHDGRDHVHSHSSSKSTRSNRSSKSSNSISKNSRNNTLDSSSSSSNSSGKPLSKAGQHNHHDNQDEQGTDTLAPSTPTWQQRLSHLQHLTSVDEETGPDTM